MEVDEVVRELRRLNGSAPLFNPKRASEQQISEWLAWSAGDALASKFEEQCSKRTAEAGKKAKAARSISTDGPRARDFITR